MLNIDLLRTLVREVKESDARLVLFIINLADFALQTESPIDRAAYVKASGVIREMIVSKVNPTQAQWETLIDRIKAELEDNATNPV